MEKRRLGKTDLEVSVLGLGTVELGLKYGIGVETAPPREEAIRVLQAAVEKDITYIDTARGYGVAEELVGESGVGNRESVIVGTKCAQFYEKGEDPRGEELKRRIMEEIEASRTLLKRDVLDLVQIHGAPVEVLERGELVRALREIQASGKVRYFGAATRGETAALAAIRSGFFSMLQTAMSILDQRMLNHVLPEAHALGVGVIVRSVLLKGALTPRREKLPEHLKKLREQADAIADFAKQHGLSLEETAGRFALSLPGVSTMLFGTTNVHHLEQNIAHVEKGPLPAEIFGGLKQFRLEDENIIDPKHWGT